jgi:hypothetical protein
MSASDDDKDNIEHLGTGLNLRVVPQTDAERPLPAADTELKALLDDLKRRYRVMHERLEGGGDPPEAA